MTKEEPGMHYIGWGLAIILSVALGVLVAIWGQQLEADDRMDDSSRPRHEPLF